MIWSTLAFAVLTGLLLFSAYKTVASRFITHAALYLALALFSVAGVFILLEAPFLAAAQILVYVGAVLAVVIFAVMLSDVQDLGGAGAEVKGWMSQLRSPYWGSLPIGIAGLLALLIIVGIGGLTVPAGVGEPDTSVAGLGRALFTTYLIPFEIAGVLLLVAMVGAIVMAREGSQS